MASNPQEYVYIEAECPKITDFYLCEQKIGHQIRTQTDCIHKLIHSQEIDGTCNTTSVLLAKEALMELDSQNYIISFPRPTKVQMICNQEQHQMLNGSFLANIPHNCRIKAPEFTLVNIEDKVQGLPIELINIPWPSSTEKHMKINFNLTTVELANLHNIQKQITMQEPIALEEVEDSIYHTTIPLYIIALLSTLALVSYYIYYRKNKISKQRLTKCETSTQADLELEIRRATFAVDVGK